MNAKKLLLGTLGAVASLGISANAMAYYGEPAAIEFPSGFYVGLQAGYAQTWWKNLDNISEVAPFNFTGSSGDYAGRALFGYDFNEFFALELGVAYFRGDEISATDKTTGAQFYSQNMKAYAIDLVGKIALPLDNGFRVYTKFGAQYFHSAQAPLFFDVAPFIVDDPDRRNVQMLFGIGVAYAVTQAFFVDLSWTYYRGDEDLGEKYLPGTDFYAFGITYKFLCY